MGDLPLNFGGESPVGPPPDQWQPTYPPQPLRRPRTWPAIALASIAALVGAAALVVSLTRPTSSSPSRSSTITSAPATYSADETATAHQKLCDIYKLASRAIQIDTNGTNQERANIATVNGAVMLEEAVNSSPAIAPSDRATALALAEAYSNAAAVSSTAGGDDPAWRSAVNDVIAKDAPMKKLCGGG